MGVGSLSTPTIKDSTTSYSSQLAFGAGALVNFSIKSWLTIEPGLFYEQRKYSTSVTALGSPMTVTETQDILQIPVAARVWFGNAFSIGAGGYYGKYLSDVRQDTSTPLAEYTSYFDYERAKQKTWDAGLLASVSYIKPIRSYKTRFDVRYLHGLINNNTSGSAAYFQEISLLFGLSFGSQATGSSTGGNGAIIRK